MSILEDLRGNFGESLGRLVLGSKPDGSEIHKLIGFWPRPLIRFPRHLDYEWKIGLHWYLKRIEGNRVLDTGFVEHLGFTKLLVELGFEVYGVDLKGYSAREFKAIQCLVWETSHHCSGFDTIVANSLLEHLGLRCYGQPEFKEAQKATIDDFYEILNPKGLLLVQVPYGRYPILVRYRNQDFYRISTSESLSVLLEGFEIEEKVFFIKATKGWIEASESIANKVQQGGGFPSCMAYIKARKV